MHARVSTLQWDPGRIDEAVRQFEEQDLPTLKGMDGFKGFTIHVDRSSGKAIGISYWDSKEQMDASEDAATPLRQRAADAGGASAPPHVEHFEVAIDTFVE
jgi:heme-degrading monooxygenase HmoA